MAEAFEIRIGNLITEFLAHAFCVFGLLTPAGAVAARALETLFNDFYNLGIRVERNSHNIQLLYGNYFIRPENMI